MDAGKKLHSSKIDTFEAYRTCRLCPRRCGAHRLDGERGVCGADHRVFAARAALHFWEEPCLSGTDGSGAVFFCGCALRCRFCQNAEISAGNAGTEVSVPRLAELFLRLQAQHANNINLVTATQYVPSVAAALLEAKDNGLTIPVVYNSSGYELPETLAMLEGLVDIYLPDFKYASGETAAACSRAADYPETARRAIAEMARQQPAPVFDPRGMMRKGVIVRHLLLPGHVKEAKAIVRELYETYGDRIYFSLMSQYTPMPKVKEDPLLGRRVTKREYERLLQYVLELGIQNAYTQEREVARESFIPAFDGEGIT